MIEVDVEGVRLVWSGGRLADVVMPTRRDRAPHAVEALQVVDYDWERGEPKAPPAPEAMRDLLIAWIREDYSRCWEWE